MIDDRVWKYCSDMVLAIQEDEELSRLESFLDNSLISQTQPIPDGKLITKINTEKSFYQKCPNMMRETISQLIKGMLDHNCNDTLEFKCTQYKLVVNSNGNSFVTLYDGQRIINQNIHRYGVEQITDEFVNQVVDNSLKKMLDGLQKKLNYLI